MEGSPNRIVSIIWATYTLIKEYNGELFVVWNNVGKSIGFKMEFIDAALVTCRTTLVDSGYLGGRNGRIAGAESKFWLLLDPCYKGVVSVDVDAHTSQDFQ